MVLKVEPYDETKPILDSTASSEIDDTENKLQEAYRNIASSMKADPLSIDKPMVALDLFSTAVKIQNVPLAKQCIENLKKRLDKTNVLLILQYLSKFKKYDDTEPSAPPPLLEEEEEEEYENNNDWVQDLIDNLRNNCLLVIDKNAEFILKQKEMLDSTYSDILTITTRDTLLISSEIFVYSVVMRWCIEECKRRTLEIQKINITAVLRDLTYAPRYGLMSKKEFLCRTIDGVKGPDRSGILNETETEIILEYIKKKGKNGFSVELPYKGSQPRKIANEIRYPKSKGGKESRCDRLIINFFTCWTAIFD